MNLRAPVEKFALGKFVPLNERRMPKHETAGTVNHSSCVFLFFNIYARAPLSAARDRFGRFPRNIPLPSLITINSNRIIIIIVVVYTFFAGVVVGCSTAFGS